jgi:hypothetical protein
VLRLFGQGIKNSLQWRPLHDEGELMAGRYISIQEQKPKPKKNFCVEVGGRKMPDPEEDPAALSIQKLLVQTGTISPISDPDPQPSQPCISKFLFFMALALQNANL